MSIIIIKEKGSKKIEEGILKRCLSECADGWGIAWHKEGIGIGLSRNDKMELFMDYFKRKEAEDIKMIAYLSLQWSGDKSYQNLQPIYIHKLGLLLVNMNGSVLKSYPSHLVQHNPDKTLKSDEALIGDMLKELSLEHDDLTPVRKFNKFLKQESKLLSKVNLVLMTEDGEILNNNPENGFYRDGSKIWISEPDLIEVSSKSEGTEEISYKLDKWEIVRIEEFEEFDRGQLLHLCENFSPHIAEIIKYGQCGYVETDYEQMVSMKKCFDCETYEDVENMKSFFLNTRQYYLCESCFDKNGV